MLQQGYIVNSNLRSFTDVSLPSVYPRFAVALPLVNKLALSASDPNPVRLMVVLLGSYTQSHCDMLWLTILHGTSEYSVHHQLPSASTSTSSSSSPTPTDPLLSYLIRHNTC
jgi:hypothetical protein